MSTTWSQDLYTYLRTLKKTRSLAAAWHLCSDRPGIAEINLPGFGGSFRLRRGTTDAQFLRDLASGDYPKEYELPQGLNPAVIFDIGANIGAVSAALLRRYPRASLFAFEPLPENARILQHNLAAFPNATVLPYGLGNRTAELTFERSDDPRNFGGGGFNGAQQDAARCVERIPVLAVAEALERLKITQIDLIKIDAEGAEYDILTNIPPETLRTVQAIVGELHDKPNDPELLKILSSDFTLEVVFDPQTNAARYFRALRKTPNP